MSLFESPREKAARENAETARIRAYNNKTIADEKNRLAAIKESNRHEEALIKLNIEKIKAENKNLELKLKLQQLEMKKEAQAISSGYFSSGCTSDEAKALEDRIKQALKGE